MADRMYQVTAMGVLDAMLVAVKVYTSEDGHWELLMQREELVRHDMDEGTADDLLAIARALVARAGDQLPPT